MAKATFRYCIVKYHTRHCIRYIKNHMKSYSIISTTHFYSIRFIIKECHCEYRSGQSSKGPCLVGVSADWGRLLFLRLHRYCSAALCSSQPTRRGDTSQSASKSSRIRGTASVRPEAALILITALPSVQGLYSTDCQGPTVHLCCGPFLCACPLYSQEEVRTAPDAPLSQ